MGGTSVYKAALASRDSVLPKSALINRDRIFLHKSALINRDDLLDEGTLINRDGLVHKLAPINWDSLFNKIGHHNSGRPFFTDLPWSIGTSSCNDRCSPIGVKAGRAPGQPEAANPHISQTSRTRTTIGKLRVTNCCVEADRNRE